ncbi:MAG: hypothetical protein V5A47_04625 [Bacteroidales bacterium]
MSTHTIRKIGFTTIIFIILFYACSENPGKTQQSVSWQTELEEKLPLLGHRNWILVVDKAFPLQTGEGIEVLYTGEQLLPVLSHVLSEVEKADHVNPTVYTDKELQYLNDNLVGGIEKYKDSLKQVIPENTESMLHDSVFTKIKEASQMFQILVLKTDQTMAYSSVFIELGCQYWPTEKENKLRSIMENEL